MTPEDREFAVELRRHLVGIVGLLERYANIDPAPPKWCAGCSRCEAINRQQQDAHYTKRMSVRTTERGSNN